MRAAAGPRRGGEEDCMPTSSGDSSSESSGTSLGASPGGRFGPYVVLTALLIIVLVVMNVLVLAANNPNRLLGPHYYVAAGDSISFGYQPNGTFFSGFADDLFAQLKQGELDTSKSKVQLTLANYACAGEKTDTMINGGCPFRNFIKEPYACPQICSQLDAVTTFLTEHQGNVSPVTFELGANDVLPDFNSTTCTPLSSGDADLATMDDNLTRVDPANPDDPHNAKNGILPRLVNALRIAPPLPGPGRGQVRLAGDLVMLNYYNPFAQKCPGSADFIHTLNNHLAKDAALFHIPIVDVYAAFGGDAGMAANICKYTWFCSNADFHPTAAGYQVIAQAVQTVLGYPHSLPIPVEQGDQAPPAAAFRQADG
jgi:lysophospholipase L1-like esterase